MLYRKKKLIKTIFSMSFFLASLPVQVAHWVPEPLTLHQAEIPSTFYPHYHLQPEMIASIECYPEGSAPCPQCPALFTSKQELYSHISELADTLSFIFDDSTLGDLPVEPLELEAFKDLPLTADQQLMDTSKIHTKELASRTDQPFNALTNQQTFTDQDLPLPNLGILPSDFFETLASDPCAQLRPEISAHPFNTPLDQKTATIPHRPITSSEMEEIEKLYFKNNRIVTCPFCKETFSAFTKFTDHMTGNGISGPYYCEECKFISDTSGNFIMHLRSKLHQPTEKTYSPDFSQSREHQQLHYRDTDFIQKYLRAKDLQSSQYLWIKCPDCTFEDRSLNRLEEHLEKTLGKKPYICTYCDKEFRTHGSLMRHIETHPAEKRIRLDEPAQPAPTREGDDAV